MRRIIGAKDSFEHVCLDQRSVMANLRHYSEQIRENPKFLKKKNPQIQVKIFIIAWSQPI